MSKLLDNKITQNLVIFFKLCLYLCFYTTMVCQPSNIERKFR